MIETQFFVKVARKPTRVELCEIAVSAERLFMPVITFLTNKISKEVERSDAPLFSNTLLWIKASQVMEWNIRSLENRGPDNLTIPVSYEQIEQLRAMIETEFNINVLGGGRTPVRLEFFPHEALPLERQSIQIECINLIRTDSHVLSLIEREVGNELNELIGACGTSVCTWHIFCQGGSVWNKFEIFDSPFGNSIALVNGGKWLACADFGKEKAWIVDVDTGEKLHKLAGHKRRSMSLTGVNGGKWLAAGSSDNYVIIWNVETGKMIKKLKGSTGAVGYLTAVNERNWIIGSSGNDIRIWDIETGNVLKKFEGHSTHVSALLVVNKNDWLASGTSDGTILIWDIETGKELKRLKGHTGDVLCMVVLNGGKWLATGSVDKTIRIWDIETGKELKKLEGHAAPICSLTTMNGGKRLVSASRDAIVLVWSIKAEKELKKIGENI